MRITVLALSGLAVVLFACSSESPSGTVRGANSPTGGDDDSPSNRSGTNGSNTTTSSSSGSATTTNPTEPAPSGDTATCAAKANQEQCFTCCEGAAPAAMAVFDKAFSDCMCAADKCGTQCAQTACANKAPTPGDACDKCGEQQFEACDQVAVDACKADAACAKVIACDEAAKCADKPEQ